MSTNSPPPLASPSPSPSPSPSLGVWEVFSDEQAAAFVHAALRRGLDLGAICRDLVAQAAVRGSRDDKSAVIPPVGTSWSAYLGLGCSGRPGRHGMPRGPAHASLLGRRRVAPERQALLPEAQGAPRPKQHSSHPRHMKCMDPGKCRCSCGVDGVRK